MKNPDLQWNPVVAKNLDMSAQCPNNPNKRYYGGKIIEGVYVLLWGGKQIGLGESLEKLKIIAAVHCKKISLNKGKANGK